MKLLTKKIIYGCEARGDWDSPYLTRITFIETAFFALYLHIFHRSDADDLHDHPWKFITFILWRGYLEETPGRRRRVWPGMILYRPAKHLHRVELINGKKAITIVLRGHYERQWGFVVKNKWIQWQQYFLNNGC